MIHNLITSPLLRQYAAVITVNLSVICLGLGIAWPSPVLVKLRTPGNETVPVLSRPITEKEGSWIVSVGFLVCTFANLGTAYLVGRLGRKQSVLLACAPKFVSCIFFVFASEVWMLIVGRILNAIADCVLLTVVPMYASEIATKEIRGSLGIVLQIASSIGIVLMLSIGPFLSYTALNVAFLCTVVITTIPIFFLPDSPYFLYAKGDTEGSLKVLTYLRGSEQLAREEIQQYSIANPEEKLDKKSLLHDKVFLKTIGIVFVLALALQAVGFNAISFYLQTILQSTRTTIKPEVASAIVGFIQLVASFCTAAVTDKFGRKTILTSTLLFMTLGMVGLGTFFYLQSNGQQITGFLNFLPLASLIIVVFSFSAGCGSLFWMVLAELFDGRTRGIGCSFGICASTFFVFLSANFFAPLTNAIGPAATYWLFAVNCVLLALFITFCLPETKGKSFAEIQVALGAKGVRKDVEDSGSK